MNEKFSISRQYRTGHSINDDETQKICDYVEKNNVKKFLDYGCNFGHLSVELALRYDIEVTAVDNFVGTIDDHHMIASTFNNRDCFDIVAQNINEYADKYKGSIILMRSQYWHAMNIKEEYDMIFIDSSHREEEAYEFIPLCDSVKSGGVVSGHDYCEAWPGVIVAIKLIQDKLEWIEDNFYNTKTSVWFQRKK